MLVDGWAFLFIHIHLYTHNPTAASTLVKQRRMACADWLMQAWMASREGCSTTEGAVRWTFTSKNGCTDGGWWLRVWVDVLGVVVWCVGLRLGGCKLRKLRIVYAPAGCRRCGGGGTEEGARGDALLEGVHAVLGAVEESLLQCMIALSRVMSFESDVHSHTHAPTNTTIMNT